jgi:hypothetical protein
MRPAPGVVSARSRNVQMPEGRSSSSRRAVATRLTLTRREGLTSPVRNAGRDALEIKSLEHG